MIQSVKDIIQSSNNLENYPELNDFYVHPPSIGQIAFSMKFHFSAFFLKSLFLWLPDVFFNARIPCINSCASPSVKRDGFNPYCRRAVLQNDICFIVSHRFKCTSCNVQFNSYDPAVLLQLPNHIQQAFPFQTSHKNAIATSIVRGMFDNIIDGNGVAGMYRLLKNSHVLRYRNAQRMYLEAVVHHRKNSMYLSSQFKSFLANPPLFEAFDVLYKGQVLSEHYLRDVWLKFFFERPAIQDSQGKFDFCNRFCITFMKK